MNKKNAFDKTMHQSTTIPRIIYIFKWINGKRFENYEAMEFVVGSNFKKLRTYCYTKGAKDMK